MPREFTRSDRVAAQLQRELADLLRTRLQDPALGMVTVNSVEVTRDMSLAKAYVSFLGNRDSTRACIKTLSQAVPGLRHELGKRMRLRVMPELRFVHDESVEHGMRIDALLKGLEPGGAEEPPEDS